MSTLKYVGRSANSDFSVLTKSYVQQRYEAVRVNADYINAQMADVGTSLVTTSYVDDQDSLRAKKSAVDLSDANYVLASSRGQQSGVVPVGADGFVDINYFTTIVQNTRKMFYTNATQVFLSSVRNVSTISAKEYQVATMTIPDPGYPYYPMCFASIRGGAVNATQAPNRSTGTPNFGQVTILSSDNIKYGWCITNSRKVNDFHLCMPFGDNTITPSTRPPVTGALTLGLWIGLWGGTTYTFDPAGLQFFSLNYPAV